MPRKKRASKEPRYDIAIYPPSSDFDAEPIFYAQADTRKEAEMILFELVVRVFDNQNPKNDTVHFVMEDGE